MAMGPFLTNRSECPTHNSPPAMRRTPSICPQRKKICMSHIGHFNVCAEILDHQTRHLHLPTCICSCACLWWPHFFLAHRIRDLKRTCVPGEQRLCPFNVPPQLLVHHNWCTLAHARGFIGGGSRTILRLLEVIPLQSKQSTSCDSAFL